MTGTIMLVLALASTTAFVSEQMSCQGPLSTDYGKVLAYVSIAVVLAVIFDLFAERLIITGLTASAIKG